MSLKIAHIDTERTWRGGEQQVFSLIEGLNAHGFKNLVVVRAESELEKRLKGVAPTMAVSPFGEWDFITAHTLNRRFKKEQIDVVHAHTGHGVALAVLATLGTNIPVVATRRVDFRVGGNFFSRLKYNRTRRIVAISEGVKRVLLDSGIEESKISVVPSGIDFNRYKNVQPLNKSDMGVSPGSILVGQVAALAPHKDQNNLLETAALLKKEIPSIQFVIVGEGELHPVLEAKARSLGLEKTVQFVGFRDKPLDYLAGFDVFCLSSKEEGLGTSLLDSMALNIPVVATRVGGIPELVQDKVTGYLAMPSNPKDLARAIKECIFDKDKNRLILLQAAKKAKEFDISHTVSRMEAIYSELSTELST